MMVEWKKKTENTNQNLTLTHQRSSLPTGQQRLPSSSVSPPASPFFPGPKKYHVLKKKNNLEFNTDYYQFFSLTKYKFHPKIVENDTLTKSSTTNTSVVASETEKTAL